MPRGKPEDTKLNDGEEDADEGRLGDQGANLKEPARGEVRVETAEEITIPEALLSEAPRCNHIQDTRTEERYYEDALHGRLSYR